MCGIVGYFGEKSAFDILINGLKKLEYRGYDSCGISIASSDTKSISTQKVIGKDMHSKLKNVTGTIGIAHTRWATHGKVTTENSHPHSDCNSEIYIVHNGIIENYRTLKSELLSEGHTFRSETDSEVIAHLIEKQISIGHTTEAAFNISLSKLKGSYSILMIKKDERKLFGARKGLPLCIGILNNDIIPSSDVLAFTEITDKVIFLKDGDAFEKNEKGIKIYNTNDYKKVERQIETIHIKKDIILKSHDSYMIKEIVEQSESIANSINQNKFDIDNICNLISNSNRIFLIGCGSSYNACLVGSYLFSDISKIQVTPIIASEYEKYEKFFDEKTLIIAISQSGETLDTLNAVNSAKERGSKIVSIINRENSILSTISDITLFNKCGDEVCVLSTKSYTTQVSILYILSSALCGKYEEAIQKIKNIYVDIINLTSKTFRERVKEVANLIYKANDLYIIGRGIQYPTALEAALKIKEISYIHAEAFAGGELKHGNLALITTGTLCVVLSCYTPSSLGYIAPPSLNESKILSDSEEIKSRGGYIIGIGYWKDHTYDCWIKVPDVGELNAITQIIPMQLLAYELAILKGINPDRPRNLAKSVTV